MIKNKKKTVKNSQSITILIIQDDQINKRQLSHMGSKFLIRIKNKETQVQSSQKYNIIYMIKLTKDNCPIWVLNSWNTAFWGIRTSTCAETLSRDVQLSIVYLSWCPMNPSSCTSDCSLVFAIRNRQEIVYCEVKSLQFQLHNLIWV